ncbi:MAG TPA: CSLREA domain-containing protein [Anaerolineae bacterium]|nr:CSLREA domain-containing protein [Anaerolineae bacterium]
MVRTWHRTRNFVVLLILGATLLAGCGLFEDIADAFSEACSVPEFVVTKTDDTNDSLCTAEDCSLREAVVMANACPGAQTIRVPDGTYVLDRHGVGEDFADTGDLDILDDLAIYGDTLAVIDGDAADRVFDISGSVVVSMLNLVIQNGQEQGGAGIENEGDLTISDCSITDNHAVVPPGGSGYAVGGGIFSGQSAIMTIVYSQINNNTATDQGGGIANFVSVLNIMNSDIAYNASSHTGGGLWNQIAATATLNGVTVEGNEATDDGGGIYNDGTLEIIGGSLTRNTASRGAGLFNSDTVVPGPGDPLGPGNATLSLVRIHHNNAEIVGAGVWNGGHFELNQGEFFINSLPNQGGGMFNGPDGEAFLYDAWFFNNTADLGGGVYNQGLIHFYRSSFTSNTAVEGMGGAIFNDSAMPGVLLRNVTVSNNMADPATAGGAGIFNYGGDLDISFTTIAYNNPDGIRNSIGGHVGIKSSIIAYHSINCTGVGSPSLGYNIDSQFTCGFIEPTDMNGTDPMLDWLAMNGGINPSHAPLPGSPAVDTGDPSMCTSEDQRTVSRPQGAGCDRGSIELTDDPLPTPTRVADDPLEMDFYDDGNYLLLGQCTTLHWEVQNAETILLNGNPVDPQGLEYVCPQSTTTYILLAWNASEQVQQAITVEVDLGEPPAAPAQFSISRRVCDKETYQLTFFWIDMADNETGFRIYRDGQLVATLNANVATYSENPPRGVAHTYGIEAFNSAGASSRPTLQEGICQ